LTPLRVNGHAVLRTRGVLPLRLGPPPGKWYRLRSFLRERRLVVALTTLLHVLVFVYWLGGDIGAYYTSSIVSDANRSREARVMAAQALNNLDMAPRTALILTLPTGLALADAAGWALVPDALVWAVLAASLAWLWLAWRIHLKHLLPTNPLRRLDLAIRWVVLIGLAAVGGAVIAGLVAWPLFLGLKLIILAATVATGLWVRALLAPFGPAFVQLAQSGPTPEGDRMIAQTLARVRPAVLLIWALLIAAAFLGIWKPS
jgi:hypothetical protein